MRTRKRARFLHNGLQATLVFWNSLASRVPKVGLLNKLGGRRRATITTSFPGLRDLNVWGSNPLVWKLMRVENETGDGLDVPLL